MSADTDGSDPSELVAELCRLHTAGHLTDDEFALASRAITDPVGFQNAAHVRPAVIDLLRCSGTITAVSLRLLYLIFRRVLGLILLLGRSSSIKNVELIRRGGGDSARGDCERHRSLSTDVGAARTRGGSGTNGRD